MKKNTLIFLSVEGLGLNKQWKGNYFKLANKPNINHLISGIYPWAILSNDSKKSKIDVNKKFNAVSADIDKNFYQMLYGNPDILTANERLKKLIENKELHKLDVFESLRNHSLKHNSKCVHMFFLLSDNKYHCDIDNVKYISNILIKNGLYPIFHLISDGKDDKQFSFSKHLESISSFCLKRNIPIATIAGRDNVFIKLGQSFEYTKHVEDYFYTICGIGTNDFNNPKDYADLNLYNKTYDQKIIPAYNSSLNKFFIEKNDMLLFLGSDQDNFSPLLKLIKQEKRLDNVLITSLCDIYGSEVDATILKDDFSKDSLITSMASKENLKSLVLSLNHKRGFVNKFYGSQNDPNTIRKAISTDFANSDADYIFGANKFLIDKTISSIGKYDFIIVHVPTIAEAAHTSDMKLLKFAIENFDKNLGRLINYAKFTGNIITFVSPYGAAEKMLNKRLHILPYNKTSVVPFIFTNGYLSSKKLTSDFFGLYSTLLVTLGLENLDEKTYFRSLITKNFSKNEIQKNLEDHYNVWKDNLATPLIEQFEENNLSLYNDLNKSEEYINQKRQYIVLKEIIKAHDKYFSTPESRKKLFDVLLEYIKYNDIDFVGFKYNYNRAIMTLFDDEIKLSKMTKLSNRFFDSFLWRTQIKRNSNWVNKVKDELTPIISRKMPKMSIKKINKILDEEILPYSFFTRLFKSEVDILNTNDAFKIAEFYDNVEADVDDVYNKYFGPKVPGEDEEVPPDSPFNESDFKKVIAYYEIFKETLYIVKESKNELEQANRKYAEMKSQIDVSYDDLFDAEPFKLNPLTRKIVNNYSRWFRSIKMIIQDKKREIKKNISKYDLKYNKRYQNAIDGIAYEGEFLEGINFDKQEQLNLQMIEKVKYDGFLDYPTIDIQEEKEYTKVTNLGEEEVVLDDGTVLVIPDVSGSISIKGEYDLTTLWNEKRIEEFKDRKNFMEFVGNDAADAVKVNKKIRAAEQKLEKYTELNSLWTKKEKQSVNSN